MFLNSRHLRCQFSESPYAVSDMIFQWKILICHSCEMQKEIEMLKRKIDNEMVINKESAIHNPESFQKLCISRGVTKLFDTILN